MKFGVLAMLLLASQAFAGPRAEVKGWHNCQHAGGQDLFWYQTCHVEAFYETGDCKAAYEELKKIDCCAETGGHRYSFRAESCQVRG